MSDFIEVKANSHSLTNRKPVFWVGINDANYITRRNIGGSSVVCPFYRKWLGMLERCYSEKYHKKQPAYIGCSVCDEWLLFSNFKSWMKKQDWQGKQLDKDILIQGNKVYSSLSCLFVTQAINALTTDSRAARGEFPPGVCYHKRMKKYHAKVSVDGKRLHIGYYEAPELAFEAYKEAKYKVMKDVALKQSEPLRSALMRWAIT